MVQKEVHIKNPLVWGDGPSTPAEKFFEAYAHAVETGSFAQTDMTEWYGDLTEYRSETGKVFYGAAEMKQWMVGLFPAFEKVEHIPEFYVEFPNSDGSVTVHASFRRRFWLKGNIDKEPDTDTPMAWLCTIGPAKGGNGYLGLHFHKVNLYWDKTKTVQLLGKALPSDKS